MRETWLILQHEEIILLHCSVENAMGGPSLGSKRLPGKQAQTEKGVNNANARRARAFRAGLVRVVALLHDAFLQQLRDGTKAAAAGTGEREDGAPQEVGSTSALLLSDIR